MLFGRERETARIEDVLRAARGGSGRRLVLRGEAGVGKSALLAHARRRARGMLVLQMRGVAAETNLPFAGLAELLAPVIDRAASLPQPQRDALRGAVALAPSSGSDRFAVGVATLGLLAAVSERSPVLALVEDAHWLDSASADALAFAARRLDAEGLALLVAVRAAGPTPFAGFSFEELVVAGLDVAAVAALLGARTGQRPAQDVAGRLAAATGGNALALVELARELTPRQLAGVEPLPDPLPALASAERLFAGRIASLDAQARRALLLATLAGERDVGALLAAGARCDVEPEAFERVEASGLLALEQGRLAFCHPLARSAAYGSATPAERRRAHRALAGVTSGERRAWHLAHAVLGSDERAAGALDEAADSARRRGAFAEAAAALERAAHLSDDRARRTHRLIRAADAARLAGRGEHALRLLDDAGEAVRADPRRHAQALHLRYLVELSAGRARAASRHQADAGERLRAIDPHAAAGAFAEAGLAAAVGGDHREALRLAELAQRLLAADGPPAIRGTAGLVYGYALYRAGALGKAAPVLLSAAALIEERAAREPAVVAFAALMLVLLGRHERADALLHPLEAELRAAGALETLPLALCASAALDLRRGRWARAHACAAEAADIAAHTGHVLWRCQALACVAFVDAAQGRASACRAHAADAHALAGQVDLEPVREAWDALGLLALGAGDAEAAIAVLERSTGVPGDRDALQLRESTPDLVEAYVREGDPRAATVAARASEQVGTSALPALRSIAARCNALVAADEVLDERFGDALALLEDADMPFALARTALVYGERLRRARRRRDARRHLRAALEVFHRLGAAPWAERAERELRATGEHRQPRDPTAAERLTPQELQIALVVARGATNREVARTLFLSPKTVERHLSVVYRKLGVRSRTDLAVLLGSGERIPA